MLKELPASHSSGEPARRWFASDDLELIVWLDADAAISGGPDGAARPGPAELASSSAVHPRGVGTAPLDELRRLEEERNLLRTAPRRVAAVHHVIANADRKIAADASRRGR